MWNTIKKACLNSLTVAWGYVSALGAVIMENLDTIATALGDPDLKAQVSDAIGDPKTVSRILLVTGIVTIIVRMRSLRK